MSLDIFLVFRPFQRLMMTAAGSFQILDLVAKNFSFATTTPLMAFTNNSKISTGMTKSNLTLVGRTSYSSYGTLSKMWNTKLWLLARSPTPTLAVS